MRVLALLILAAAPAAAETPLTAAEFEAYVTGKTLTYSAGGVPFGIEEYADRRVLWSYLDGQCQEGKWYTTGEMICFVYHACPEHQCWTFYLRDGGLFARFENDPAATELYETHQSREPMQCLGPKVVPELDRGPVAVGRNPPRSPALQRIARAFATSRMLCDSRAAGLLFFPTIGRA